MPGNMKFITKLITLLIPSMEQWSQSPLVQQVQTVLFCEIYFFKKMQI